MVTQSVLTDTKSLAAKKIYSDTIRTRRFSFWPIVSPANCTATWRRERVEQLTQEAAERDRRFAG